jgi:hypothetical protein
LAGRFVVVFEVVAPVLCGVSFLVLGLVLVSGWFFLGWWSLVLGVVRLLGWFFSA